MNLNSPSDGEETPNDNDILDVLLEIMQPTPIQEGIDGEERPESELNAILDEFHQEDWFQHPPSAQDPEFEKFILSVSRLLFHEEFQIALNEQSSRRGVMSDWSDYEAFIPSYKDEWSTIPPNPTNPEYIHYIQTMLILAGDFEHRRIRAEASRAFDAGLFDKARRLTLSAVEYGKFKKESPLYFANCFGLIGSSFHQQGSLVDAEAWLKKAYQIADQAPIPLLPAGVIAKNIHELLSESEGREEEAEHWNQTALTLVRNFVSGMKKNLAMRDPPDQDKEL